MKGLANADSRSSPVTGPLMKAGPANELDTFLVTFKRVLSVFSSWGHPNWGSSLRLPRALDTVHQDYMQVKAALLNHSVARGCPKNLLGQERRTHQELAHTECAQRDAL